MTRNELIMQICKCNLMSDALKEIESPDKPSTFMLMQMSPRVPIYQAMETDIAEQEILMKTPVSVVLETVAKGDPRAMIMFAMESFRECAQALTVPQLLKKKILASAIVMVLGYMWVETWMLRLATVQTVQGLNKIVSPFHNDEGERA